MAQLTIHVLDTHNGCSADGLRVELFKENAAGFEKLADISTNENGRSDAPLISDATNPAFTVGKYRLSFYVGDYFSAPGEKEQNPKFIDVVHVDIGVDGKANYHIPLLVTPWGYSMYRGC